MFLPKLSIFTNEFDFEILILLELLCTGGLVIDFIEPVVVVLFVIGKLILTNSSDDDEDAVDGGVFSLLLSFSLFVLLVVSLRFERRSMDEPDVERTRRDVDLRYF